MSELGETFDAWKTLKNKKKQRNAVSSLEILRNNKIEFKVLSTENYHLRIGDFDFWPSTGKFWNRKTNRKGRGVFDLLRQL